MIYHNYSFFYKIIKNVNCSTINNTDKGLYNKFKKLSIYYRILFIRMYEHKEEIESHCRAKYAKTKYRERRINWY